MVILTQHSSLQVYVECNGERLPELDSNEQPSSATTVAKYIEARSAAEFAVQVELRRPFPQYTMTVKLYINGKLVRSQIIGDVQYQRAKRRIHRTFDSLVSKISDGRQDLDYDLGERFTQNLRHMGTVTLETHFIENLRRVPTRERCVDKQRPDLGPVPEKALKGQALTHWTGLGTEKNVPYVGSSHTVFDYVNLRRLPFASFNFKYCSRRALQSLLIIPQSPALSPAQFSDGDGLANDIPELKEEDTVVDVKKESCLKREHNAIAAGDGDDDEVVFVRAVKRQRPNITVDENNVKIIDLT